MRTKLLSYDDFSEKDPHLNPVEKNNLMVLEEVKKSKFAQKNNKQYYSSNGIVSLPFAHPYLKEIIDYKGKNNWKLEKYIQSEKNNRNILLKNPTSYQIASQKRNINQNINFSQMTRSYILNSFWR